MTALYSTATALTRALALEPARWGLLSAAAPALFLCVLMLCVFEILVSAGVLDTHIFGVRESITQKAIKHPFSYWRMFLFGLTLHERAPLK